MFRERLGIGIRAGLVAAAATAGVLIGLGRARGNPFWPLNAVSHLLFGARALSVRDAELVITAGGVLAHVASVVLWAVLFALMAARLRGLRLLSAALLLAAVAFIVDYVLLPSSLSPGFEAVLTAAEIVSVYVALALSLALGVMVARPQAAGVRK